MLDSEIAPFSEDPVDDGDSGNEKVNKIEVGEADSDNLASAPATQSQTTSEVAEPAARLALPHGYSGSNHLGIDSAEIEADKSLPGGNMSGSSGRMAAAASNNTPIAQDVIMA